MADNSAKKEIHGLKNELENITGQKVNLMSFPHGAYSDKIIEFARQVGYERVFKVEPAHSLLSPNEIITGRISVSPWDWRLNSK